MHRRFSGKLLQIPSNSGCYAKDGSCSFAFESQILSIAVYIGAVTSKSHRKLKQFCSRNCIACRPPCKMRMHMRAIVFVYVICKLGSVYKKRVTRFGGLQKRKQNNSVKF